MKFYFSPASCSLAPHIVLHELELPFSAVRVDLKTKESADGDFIKINPKGYVPTIVLDSGEVLTEASVILQYLADQKPAAKLIPQAGSMQRYKAQEWLNYISTEIHKGFGILWNKKYSAETAAIATELLHKKFDFLNAHFKKSKFLMGDTYTVADAYLFTCLNWSHFLKMDLSKWTDLSSFIERIRERPAVQNALKAEGLLKAA